MAKVLVGNTTSRQLNWLVANCEGHQWRCSWLLGRDGFHSWQSYEESWGNPTPEYATDPAQGQPILERERIKTAPNLNGSWLGQIRHTKPHPLVSHPVLNGWTNQHGPTMLIAGLRCYVASKLGDAVEIPEGL